MPNQNPEQIARDNIDKQLTAFGWLIQGIKKVNLHAGIGPADYVLFVDGKPCGVVEAKKEKEGHKLKVHEPQSSKIAPILRDGLEKRNDFGICVIRNIYPLVLDYLCYTMLFTNDEANFSIIEIKPSKQRIQSREVLI